MCQLSKFFSQSIVSYNDEAVFSFIGQEHINNFAKISMLPVQISKGMISDS